MGEDIIWLIVFNITSEKASVQVVYQVNMCRHRDTAWTNDDLFSIITIIPK